MRGEAGFLERGDQLARLDIGLGQIGEKDRKIATCGRRRARQGRGMLTDRLYIVLDAARGGGQTVGGFFAEIEKLIVMVAQRGAAFIEPGRHQRDRCFEPRYLALDAFRCVAKAPLLGATCALQERPQPKHQRQRHAGRRDEQGHLRQSGRRPVQCQPGAVGRGG